MQRKSSPALRRSAIGICMTMLSETPATKGDIKDLRDEMRTYYASKADLAELKSDLIKWMIGLMLGAAAVATGFAVLIERIT